MSGTDQGLFRAAVMNPAAAVPSSLRDGSGRPAGRRFAVYRNNVAVSLTEALAEDFPACRALLGDETFRAMAGAYLRQHPPASPLMARYGAELGAFMDAAPQLSRMRWIGDLARFEFALRDSYHAADATPLGAETLAAIPPESLPERRFGLAPSVRVLRSDWPVLSIWRRATEAGAPQAQPVPEDVLIARPAYDPEPHLLGPGDAAFVDALGAGAPLGEAAEAALAVAGAHDATAILTLLIQTRSLTEPEPRP
ncbi:hypothetical protein OB2597_15535 [Pseudooceanicola batsensis HTCC2597]|uniref:Putative DNA-binding domain-containing protein n=1 Tax=Pseudooceanicola batsensis (strain ATCC BAA-863 / DSM 15984 / KCTC 12145 / HTCC2597) TaxID=252305 RepID=A3TYY9_PSEBH|nr:DNA-binding domain-containing protein [Pseudooceanicola batsensis]EAQ02807.1 hypothetical protein OB2597_15535 [Pseudooceanicola batsensis HTCC2597]